MTTSRRDIEEALARDAREEAAIEAARNAPYIAANTEAFLDLEKAMKTFWRGGLEDVGQRLLGRQSSAGSWTDGIVLNDPTSPLESGTDVALNLPTTATPRPDLGKDTFDRFISTLTATTGYTLSESGVNRLLIYAVTQCKTQCADLTQIETWQKSFERLIQLGAFFEEEIGFDIGLKTPVPQPPTPKPTLESLNLGTREGEKIAHKLLDEEYYGVEVAQLFSAWIASLETNFGYVPSEGVQREVIQFFQAKNLNFLDRRSYDRVRVAFVKNGIFPDHCLTSDEVLCARLDASGSLSDRDTRQEFLKQSRLINGQ